MTMSCVVSLEINDVQTSGSVRACWVSDRMTGQNLIRTIGTKDSCMFVSSWI
jgi:hypothetical protein